MNPKFLNLINKSAQMYLNKISEELLCVKNFQTFQLIAYVSFIVFSLKKKKSKKKKS